MIFVICFKQPENTYLNKMSSAFTTSICFVEIKCLTSYLIPPENTYLKYDVRSLVFKLKSIGLPYVVIMRRVQCSGNNEQ